MLQESATYVAASKPLLALALLTAITGCASYPTPVQDAGQTKLVIQCTLKPETEPKTVLAVANDFGGLPGVIDVSAGFEAKANPNAADHDRVVTLIVTFKDEAHYGLTVAGPDYARIRDKVLKPASSSVNEFATTLQNYLISKQFTDETDAAAQQRRAAAIKQQNDLRSQTK